MRLGFSKDNQTGKAIKELPFIILLKNSANDVEKKLKDRIGIQLLNALTHISIELQNPSTSLEIFSDFFYFF